MNRWLLAKRNYLILLLLIVLTACSGGDYNYTLTLVHVNDTHSHLEPVAVNLTIDNVKTTAQLGGFARMKTALDELRVLYPDLLLLHGGDAVQGTLYFTLFNGTVEFDFLSLIGVNAMTFGNHEFDRGCGPIPGWIGRSSFPWVSANIDFSGEPAIAPLVAPYLIKVVDGEQVAIIGATTETTPQTTLDVGKAVFNDAVDSVRKQVQALAALGINKIIVLSHLGYEKDLALASQVSGVDVVVGGHSHTLLGDQEKLSAVGLVPTGSHPTELLAPDGKRVLVVQAWQWGHVLGRLHVRFTKSGEIIDSVARITIPVGDQFIRNNAPVPYGSEAYFKILAALEASGSARIVPENPAVLALLRPYADQVEAYRSVQVATAVDDLVRGLNSGPGPLAADGMLQSVPNARAAIINSGGMRKDIARGNISVGDILEVMPFGNTLVLVDLSGAELKTALEEGIDYLIVNNPGTETPPMPYVAGMRFGVRVHAAKGSRIQNLEVKNGAAYEPFQAGATYRIAAGSFVANGGDGFTQFKNATGFRSDTGIVDSDSFRDYLKALGSVSNPSEQRIVFLP